MSEIAEIGIFGGSGFYAFAEDGIREIKVDTPYGAPSDKIALATVAGRSVAFLARHGRSHSLPPHQVPYRANLWAFKELGVTRVIAPCAVGSLQANIHPGEFVIPDQFVDRTSGRACTYYDGPVATHVSMADPYCPQLREAAFNATVAEDVRGHPSGTCVVVEGPRFSTRAESRWFTQVGWDIINMTQYPEAVLARELSMCYVCIALVTDYDAGAPAGRGAVQAVDVGHILRENTAKVKKVIHRMVEGLASERSCGCSKALDHARLE
ncbi:MAG: S-methyl-5'-thioadenosine phosphorylase [Capsulimonadaceae bacterium]